MKFDFDLDEVAKLASDLAADAAIAGGKIEPAVGRARSQLYSWATSAAPVDTGKLKAGIKFDTDGLSQRVYDTTDYGFYQEYGTSRHPPQPFLMVFADRAHVALEKEILAAKWGLSSG